MLLSVSLTISSASSLTNRDRLPPIKDGEDVRFRVVAAAVRLGVVMVAIALEL